MNAGITYPVLIAGQWVQMDAERIARYRLQCELSYICGLPDRHSRNEAIAGIAHRRGQAAADELRAQCRVWFALGNRAVKPQLPEWDEAGAQRGAAFTSRGDDGVNHRYPVSGSFPAALHEGPLRRVGSVVSEGCA